jgi:hypothetical protein
MNFKIQYIDNQGLAREYQVKNASTWTGAISRLERFANEQGHGIG